MSQFLFTNTPLKFLVQSIWRDEAFSYLLAKKNLGQIIFLTAKDFNPPLYYFILHFWMKIFGPSETSLRSLSLIFFWGTLYVAYLFLVNVLHLKTKKAFLYLLLFLINPLLNYYALEARMYSLLAFLASLSFYFFYRQEKKYYSIVTILGLYTHYFMLLVVFTQFIYVLTFSTRKKELISTIKKFFINPVLILIPWLLFTFSQGFSLQKSFWILKLNLKNILDMSAIIYTGYEYGLKFSHQWLLTVFSLLIILFLFFGLKNFRQQTRRNNLLYFLVFWTFLAPTVVFFISLFKPIFLPRYLIFATVGFLILFIYLIEQITLKTKLPILIIISVITLIYNQVQVAFRTKADIRTTIKEIKALASKDDLLYVTNVFDFQPAEYYFGEKNVYIYNKSHEEIPDYVGKILIPKDKIVSSLPFYPTKAFILKDDLTYNIQALY